MNDTEEIRLKREFKDAVFSDLFSDKEYILEMYQALHPDDKEITQKDLKLVNIRNVLTEGIYNDLSFMVRDDRIVMVEAQSTWSLNILHRVFEYYVEIYSRYQHNHGWDTSQYSPLHFPDVEIYIIYTGSRKLEKDVFSIRHDLHDSRTHALDFSVRVLTLKGTPKNIIDEYIFFCKTMDNQRKLFPGNHKRAIDEAIRICSENNVLEKYLHHKLEEVKLMMIELNKQADAIDALCNRKMNEGREVGRVEGKKELVLSMFRNGMSAETIAKVCSLNPNMVSQWIQESLS